MTPSSWTQPVDIWPVGPHADADRIAARQVRGLLARTPPSPRVPLVCLDQGYDPSRLHVDLAGSGCNYWCGCAQAAAGTQIPHPTGRVPGADQPATATSSTPATRPPGRLPA
jgi:hypothetical protein